MRTLSALLVLVSASLAAPVRADVLVVGPSGPFFSIQVAVDAAQDGDVILVRDPSGPFVVDGKSLEIIADGGPQTISGGNVIVRNTTAGQPVLISGFVVTGDADASLPDGDPDLGPALLVDGAAGPVRVVDCTLTGGDSLAVLQPSSSDPTAVGLPDGFPGASLRQSPDVAFLHCTLTGGVGGDLSGDGTGDNAPPYQGGAGLLAEHSGLSVYGSDLTGGQGGYAHIVGPRGGHGVDVVSSTLFAGGSSFTGGRGGDASDPFFSAGTGGTGGDGAHASADAVTRFQDCAFAGGGPGLDPLFEPASPGAPRTLAGTVVDLPGDAHTLELTGVVREFETLSFTIEGHPGDPVFVFLARDDGNLYVDHFAGQLHVAVPWQRLLFLGTLPPSGVLSAGTTLPAISSGFEALSFRLQTLSAHGTDGVLGEWAPLLWVDDAF